MTDATVTRTVQVALNQQNTLIIDNAVCPIYPVRYAYANFFEENLEAPARPPALKTLLNQTNMSATKGYVARLLRPSWIYIKEEVGGSNLQIFQYKHLQMPDGSVQEQFHKYLFKNGIDAKGGLIPEKKGNQYKGYPFAFVRKEVSEISIVHSMEPLSAQVIDEINASAQKRAEFMQRVNLQSDDDATVEATSDNIQALVEDYREQKDRVLKFRTNPNDPDIEELDNTGLDVLTTQASYKLAADSIAMELSRKTEYGKVARIVGLYDPVGVQQDIAEIITKLTLWETHYKASNLYPYTIGTLVQQLKKADNEDIKELVEDAINVEEHGKFWTMMEDKHTLFQERLAQFGALYKAFMVEDALTGKVGSLDNYFKHAFTEPTNSDEANEEFQKLCILANSVFSGVLGSESGQKIIEDLMAQFEQKPNALEHILLKIALTTTTTPQTGIDWSVDSLKAMDAFLLWFGPWLGKTYSNAEFKLLSAERYSHKVLANFEKFIVYKFMPGLFDVMGVTVKPGNKVVLTHDELAKVLAKALDESIRQPDTAKLTTLSRAETKLNFGKKLFDWGEQLKNEAIPKQIELSKIEIPEHPNPSGRFKISTIKNGREAIGMVFDGGFAGLSAFFNVKAINDLSLQNNQFTHANPLDSGSVLHDTLGFTSAISALTVDILAISRASVALTHASTARAIPWAATQISADLGAKITPYLARSIAPKLSHLATDLGVILSSKLFVGLVAVANFAASIDSVWKGITSIKQDNIGEATGHFMMGAASAMLAYYAVATLTAGTAFALPTGGISFLVASLIAIVLLIAGVIVSFIFGKSEFEVLLENCFWGKSDKYLFWGFEKESERPDIQDRLDKAHKINIDRKVISAYQLELQEFMNYFYLPQVEITDDKGFFQTIGTEYNYEYKFRLPGFVPGVSEIHYEIRTLHTEFGEPTNWGPGISRHWAVNDTLTENLKQSIKNAAIQIKDSMAEIAVTLKTTEMLKLHWHYEPQPGIVAPRRYLTKSGLIKEPIIGMVDEEPN